MYHPLILIFYFLENLIVAFLGSCLFKVTPPKTKYYFYFAGISTVFLYFVRLLFENIGIPIGVHSIAMIIFFVLLMIKLFRYDWFVASLATISIFCLFYLRDIFYLPLVISLLNWTPEVIMGSPLNYTILGILSEIPFIIITIIIVFKDRDLFEYRR